MPDKATERETAIAAADETCPRCGASRQTDQRYCLDCGLRLPAVTGRLASLRRRWIRRFGWYPGDWIWVSLLTLVVAVAGAAAAIALTVGRRERDRGRRSSPPRRWPSGSRRRRRRQRRSVDTSTLPTAPEPSTSAGSTAGAQNGRFAWPANENGWTIVLVSYPKTNGAASAQTNRRSRRRRPAWPGSGVLDSSSYASLQPGYLVVFTGIYGSKADADAAVPTARQAGFAGRVLPPDRPLRGRENPDEQAECVYSAENICNSPWERVESTAGRVAKGGFTAS